MAALSDSGHGSVRSMLVDGFDDFPKRTDFQWLATGGREGDAPVQTNCALPLCRALRDAKRVGSRSAIHDRRRRSFGTNHQHEDALSFELSAYGERLITDPGSYRYNYDSPWRMFMVSSLAHNTLAVDHQGQCRRERRETWIAKEPMPNVWKPGKELTYLRGDYTNGYGAVEDCRAHAIGVLCRRPLLGDSRSCSALRTRRNTLRIDFHAELDGCGGRGESDLHQPGRC